MIQNAPNQSRISELQSEIGDLQAQVEYWKKQYEDKKFDFSGATVTVADLPYGVTAWDGNGVLITGEQFISPITGIVGAGRNVTFAGKSWIVQHVDGKYAYLASNGIVSTGAFASSNSNVYANSDILNITCKNYETTLGSDAMSYCQSVTVNGGTSKVFIPSYDQYCSEWDWPKQGNTNRVQTGDNGWYWTSTPDPLNSGCILIINYDGSYSGGVNANHTYGGFLPAVKVQFKA